MQMHTSRISVISRSDLGPTPDFAPLNSANSGLPVPQSCTPELAGLQLCPLGSHGFLCNEGLLSVFPFICLTVKQEPVAMLSFSSYASITMLPHMVSYLLFNLLLSPSVITIRILL
jgi:hypothetical protein